MKVNVMTVMTDLITIAVMTRQVIAHDGEFLASFLAALGRAPKDPRGLGTPERFQRGCKDCLSPQVPLLEDSS